MGATASIDINETLELEKVKELCGTDNWNEKLESRFNDAVERNGSVKLNDLKFLAPQLFNELLLTLEETQQLLVENGKEWNEELTNKFNENAIEGKMALGSWAALVPTLFETADERAARLKEEYEAVLAARAEGTVTIVYQMYNEKFTITKNTLTTEAINDEYALVDVMPGCRLLLSTIDPTARTAYVNAHFQEAPYVREEPEGTFKDLLCDETYYCSVIENPDQYKKDMAEQKKKMQSNAKDEKASKGPIQESCSCLFGNPCVDQYICKDWNNRVQVATKNGWKGF